MGLHNHEAIFFLNGKVIGHLEIVLGFRLFARYFVRTKKNRFNPIMVYGWRGGKAPGMRRERFVTLT
jgi:hypothetical protein